MLLYTFLSNNNSMHITRSSLYCYSYFAGTMPPNVLTLDQVGAQTRNFTVHVMITKKGLPKSMSSSSSSYQRLLLEDAM